MIHSLVFYMFAGIALLCGAVVITARNPVHSVLFLILAFFNGAGLLLLLGAEFLAMILVIVYVGAVAVLFLFVVMMLDIDLKEMRRGFVRHAPVGGLVGLVLVVELLLTVTAWHGGLIDPAGMDPMARTPNPLAISNTQALGSLIYTHYAYLFQAAGLILLVAMIGAIVLTLRQREGVRRQRIASQTARRPEDAVEIVSVKPGEGL